MKNVEKSKRLREVRKDLRWDQAQMAEALGLTRTYVSELENGKAPIKDYIMDRVEILAGRPESMRRKSSENPHPQEDVAKFGEAITIRHKCHAYLDSFLDACGNDQDKLRWTFVELQKHFPLGMWGRAGGHGKKFETPEDRSTSSGGVSSSRAAEGEELLE